MEPAGELRVLPQAVAVAADVDDVAVVDESIDQRGRHDLIAKDLAPLFEAFVARENGGGVLVAPGDQLEEEHRAGTRDRQIADLVDHHETREDERAQAVRQSAAGLRVFERVQQIGERREVDAPAALRRGDRETEREVRFADAGRPEEDDILLPLDEAERVQALDLLAFERVETRNRNR